MGRKVLKDHANTFCQMFMGWRMGDDLDTFSQLPDGVLTINALNGTCEHDSIGLVRTHIALEIAAWFAHRLDEHGIDRDDVVDATLTVQMTRPVVPPKHKRGITCHWKCEGLIRTSDREYRARLAEPHTWIPIH